MVVLVYAAALTFRIAGAIREAAITDDRKNQMPTKMRLFVGKTNARETNAVFTGRDAVNPPSETRAAIRLLHSARSSGHARGPPAAGATP